ncbi:F-box domain containing protein [Rhynchospora pubera]|uniref:F-box domain containing protein n=1 Tax=Rhynchospora pubera TaxID=906938 RepID=A0AAV8BW86_9POAL|nr:F-box domain containing protein [Rhynchospora pubera]
MAGTNPSYSHVGASLVQRDAFISQQSLIEHPAVSICLLPFLDVWDVLSLGSCSKSLRGICESEETWKLLYMRRFDPLTLDELPKYYQASAYAKGWKTVYITKYMNLPAGISAIYIKCHHPMDGDFYPNHILPKIEYVKRLILSYEDVYFFFIRKELSVLINLLGLYYAFFCLGVSVEDINKDMVTRNVADKKVTLNWCWPSKHWNGFYMQEEKCTKVFSLKEIVERGMSFFYFLKYASKCPEFGRHEVTEVTVRFHQNDHL